MDAATYLSELYYCLRDNNPDIRMLAVQSICNLNDQRALQVLKDHFLLETMETVKNEIVRAINILKPSGISTIQSAIVTLEEPQSKKLKKLK
jgi:hypothetical protein